MRYDTLLDMSNYKTPFYLTIMAIFYWKPTYLINLSFISLAKFIRHDSK